MLRCGLLGKTLAHSYSPLIHSELGDYSYRLFEIPEEELGEFVRGDGYDCLNVTMPYKVSVIGYLDSLSPEAERIGAVNTVVRTGGGKLIGYNTDYYGFGYMLKRAGIEIGGRKVAVLGSGGASKTVRAYLSDGGAESVTVVSRSGETNYGNTAAYSGADLIVNATPVGMYPGNGVSPVDIKVFTGPEAAADLIFNPKRTEFLRNAEKAGVKCTGGLPMLVAQAKAASEIFQGKSIDDRETERVLEKLDRKLSNIILVGMPGSGKTRVGYMTARKTGRMFFDTDAEIEKREGATIPEIFSEKGEEYFRDLETQVVMDLSKLSGVVISTGGGAVLREENRDALRQNGRVVFLKRPLAELSRWGRPLSQGGSLGKMYEERLPCYMEAADAETDVLSSPSKTADAVLETLGFRQ